MGFKEFRVKVLACDTARTSRGAGGTATAADACGALGTGPCSSSSSWEMVASSFFLSRLMPGRIT